MAITENSPEWMQRLQPASFRGAAFYVDSVDSDFGRRTVTHEFPQRDTPFTEDLGRKKREFTITGYLVGDAYFGPRDALIAATEEAGPAELVHPYMGGLQVVCTGLTVRERRQDGGYCELAMRFVEDGENIFPSAVTNPATAVDIATEATQTAAGSWFESVYDIARMPEFVRLEMVAAANQLLSPVDRLLSTATDLADEVLAFKRDLGTIINRPRALADGFKGVINRVTTAFGKNKTSSATLRDMSRNILRPVPATTANRTRQARAQLSMQEMVRQMAVVEMARVVAGQPYESYQDALTSRSEALDEIDEVSETASDPVFDELQRSRAKLVQALPDPRLPEIQQIVLQQSTPALVLAYRVYGDAERDADIVARNRVAHPGFIGGSSAVEVVIRG